MTLAPSSGANNSHHRSVWKRLLVHALDDPLFRLVSGVHEPILEIRSAPDVDHGHFFGGNNKAPEQGDRNA
jgi:hypothetical protein